MAKKVPLIVCTRSDCMVKSNLSPFSISLPHVPERRSSSKLLKFHNRVPEVAKVRHSTGVLAIHRDPYHGRRGNLDIKYRWVRLSPVLGVG